MGEVLEYESGIAKVKGLTFVKDMFTGSMKKKPDRRIKLLAIASGTLIVYLLPAEVVIDEVEVRADLDGGLVLTNGQEFSMDISETVQKHEMQ